MKWQEVRKLYPSQFVLVSILDYHLASDKKIVDEVAPIRTIPEEEETKSFLR
ncbi:hypothetical protein [Oceanobacillus halotolerans]|uniref:hypothetical protein n=1 Tax=Oceanobacillus halotolerans TaxID=2663380 RepID=UPI00299CE8E4|nr:hypothetical protein [Oceanobacillus halotolerans]